MRSSRKVADEMEMAAILSGDAERLLHQAIRLVAITIRPVTFTIVRVAII
jgi:hypothetical protein